jgi:hypothetical protein
MLNFKDSELILGCALIPCSAALITPVCTASSVSSAQDNPIKGGGRGAGGEKGEGRKKGEERKEKKEERAPSPHLHHHLHHPIGISFAHRFPI